ncbi:hypothetical protein RFI_40415, partial [Reticulomyxa filosa]
IKELDHKISSYFNSLLQDYETSIKTMNDEELHTVLDIMKIIGNDENQFLQMVKMFMQKKVSCGIPNDSTTTNWTYSDMIRKLNAHLATMVDEIDREGVINGRTKTNDMERERFFGLLKDKLEFFKRLSQLNEHINTKIFSNCSEKLEKHVQSLMTKIKDKSEWKNTDCEQINLCYNCFTSMHKNGILSNIVKNHAEIIEDIVNKKIDQLEKEASSNLNADKVMPVLIAMKLISVYIFSFKEIVNKRIDQLLGAYKRKDTGINIPTLALKLEKDPDGIGKMIVAEHNAFKGYNVSLFNAKTRSHGIDYILERMETKGDKKDASKLKKKYDEFDSLYRELIKQNLTEDKQNMIILVNNTKLITRGIEQKPDDVNWNATIRNKIPELMAHIFALWTLQNAQFYFDAKGADNQDSYLLQPHAAQVISIFRMLGVDEKKSGPINNLVQIGTGEGKSVTLAIASSVLAFEYLSCRDFKSFEPLFTALGVIDHIHYGTFNKLCERIINEGGDVRKL